jgi:hypothetical protein
MPHEVGHNHGRQHAPCGTSGDPSYPYAGAAIGDWGYDLLQQKLYPPDSTKDLMSYCNPTWVSDYTYKAFFDRLQAVNGASIAFPAAAIDQTYDRVLVNADGTVSWLPPAKLHTPPLSNPTPITVSTSAGSEDATAHFIPYDHLPGGVVVWPQPAHATTAVSLTIEGEPITLTR